MKTTRSLLDYKIWKDQTGKFRIGASLCLMCSGDFSLSLPVGYDLSTRKIPVEDIEGFNVRKVDQAKKWRKAGTKLYINGVYFPLLSMLLPKWELTIRDHQSELSNRLVYFVTGKGIPRNRDHAMSGNSPEATGVLL